MIKRKLHSQRRKIAIAHLFLRKYGWTIIFVQRYMYGLRTIIPMSIGTTGYSAKKFALINLLSAWSWAAVTITPAYFFGKELLGILAFANKHWYLALPIVLGILFGIHEYFGELEAVYLKRRTNRFQNNNRLEQDKFTIE